MSETTKSRKIFFITIYILLFVILGVILYYIYDLAILINLSEEKKALLEAKLMERKKFQEEFNSEMALLNDNARGKVQIPEETNIFKGKYRAVFPGSFIYTNICILKILHSLNIVKDPALKIMLDNIWLRSESYNLVITTSPAANGSFFIFVLTEEELNYFIKVFRLQYWEETYLFDMLQLDVPERARRAFAREDHTRIVEGYKDLAKKSIADQQLNDFFDKYWIVRTEIKYWDSGSENNSMIQAGNAEEKEFIEDANRRDELFKKAEEQKKMAEQAPILNEISVVELSEDDYNLIRYPQILTEEIEEKQNLIYSKVAGHRVCVNKSDGKRICTNQGINLA